MRTPRPEPPWANLVSLRVQLAIAPPAGLRTGASIPEVSVMFTDHARAARADLLSRSRTAEIFLYASSLIVAGLALQMAAAAADNRLAVLGAALLAIGYPALSVHTALRLGASRKRFASA